MSTKSIEEIIRECGAIRKGHFVLAGLEHSDEYIEKAVLYQDPIIFDDLCFGLAQEAYSHFSSFTGTGIEVVVGPAPIGAVLAHRVAYHLGELSQEKVVPLFTEKDERGGQTFNRGFAKEAAGKNVLIVDDILTSGQTVRQIIRAVTLLNGRVIAVGVPCNRGGVKSADIDGYPLLVLGEIEMKTWPQGLCPLCQKNVPIDRGIGKWREFLESHPGYPSK